MHVGVSGPKTRPEIRASTQYQTTKESRETRNCQRVKMLLVAVYYVFWVRWAHRSHIHLSFILWGLETSSNLWALYNQSLAKQRLQPSWHVWPQFQCFLHPFILISARKCKSRVILHLNFYLSIIGSLSHQISIKNLFIFLVFKNGISEIGKHVDHHFFLLFVISFLTFSFVFIKALCSWNNRNINSSLLKGIK